MTRADMGKAEIPAAPIIGLTFRGRNRLRSLANKTPPAVSKIKAKRPIPRIMMVFQVKNFSATMVDPMVIPSSRVTRMETSCWVAWVSLTRTPHSRMRLQAMKQPNRATLFGAMDRATSVTMLGKRNRVVLETGWRLGSIVILLFAGVVRALITGG